MNALTRAQLLEQNRAFYAAQADAFDRSRGARAWPGWQRLIALLPGPREARAAGPGDAPATPSRLGAVLDIGCGNGRFACFLAEAGFDFRYVGVDSSPALLDAARRQLPRAVAEKGELVLHDFLATESPGQGLPAGPFALIVLMGVLHHVPGADWRRRLLEAAAARLAAGGLLALATWQFADDPREQRKRVPFEALGPVLGEPLDPAELEPGDWLLRFGEDPAAPPRYCHQVSDSELESWPDALGLEPLADFRADGARGRSNRYAVLRRP